MNDSIKNQQNRVVKSFQSVFGNEELLAKVIEFFPHPILIYSKAGKLVMTNRAMLQDPIIPVPQEIVGTYNVLTEPFIIKSSIFPHLKRAFQGETVILSDIKVPIEHITERYEMPDTDVEGLYQDMTIFPLFGTDKTVSFVVVMLINKRIYRGKSEISKAKEYLESHWLDKFDVSEAAKAAGLSKTHFVILFKKHTGVTPHEYYINYKIRKLKEKLMDINLSVSQAFAACNLDYNGRFAKVFKDKVGVSPSVYRKMSD